MCFCLCSCSDNLIYKVLQRRQRCLVMAGVHFLRTCIGTNKIFYPCYIAEHHLLNPVLDAFVANGER